MSETSSATGSPAKQGEGKPKKSKGKLPIILGGGLAVLLLAGGGSYALLPAVSGPVNRLLGLAKEEGEAHASGHSSQPAPATSPVAARPTFIEMPEITVTLPNGGRPRQLRISLSLEIVGDPILVRPAVTNPRIYDSLILYLRTLRDGELEGALALDRLRGDLFRRLELLVGANVVRDVLITNFVVV